MTESGLSVTITYPDGEQVSFSGQGALVYTASGQDDRLFAITGRFTLSDAAQLMNELMDSFGEDDVLLAAGLALAARRLETTG